MQRERGGLVPIGDALSGMPGPVQALRETPPPARRGFTVADQVHQLVTASEADPDLGFMARTMALCSLPRTTPATGFFTSGSTAPSRSTCKPGRSTNFPSVTFRAC